MSASLRTSSLSVALHKHVLCEVRVRLAAFILKSCTVHTPPLGVLVIENHLFPADRQTFMSARNERARNPMSHI